MADEAEVTKLLDQIAKQGEEWKKGTPGAREALISSAILLRPALSTPTENMLYHTWAEPSHLAVLSTAQELKLFEALAAGGTTAQSSAQIAEKCEPKAEAALVARLLRNLAAAGSIREQAADRFVATNFSQAMCREAYKDTLWFMYDYFTSGFMSFAPFVAENGYAAATSLTHTPWHHAYKAPPMPIWEHWAKETPIVGKRFANMMHMYAEGRPWWFQDGYYPIRERLIKGADTDPESIFIVDIGSGAGHDATRLLDAMKAEVPGKLVIQDRPEVIAIAENSAAPEIIKMPHDYFTEEPVKGARAYYLHSIIHDLPDEGAQKVLRAIVPAMKPGYSKILICDVVMEDEGAHWLQTTLDIMMMTALAARERTRTEFRTLAESCGLKLVDTFKHTQGVDSIVELELA